MIKKGDIIIICIIFILACIGMYFTNVEKETSMNIIQVFHDGKIVASYKVDCNFDKKFDFFDGKGGHEVYWIHDGGVEVIESNTPHKICMKMGFINRGGQMIVALPHKMYIRIISSSGQSSDLDAVVE